MTAINDAKIASSSRGAAESDETIQKRLKTLETTVRKISDKLALRERKNQLTTQEIVNEIVHIRQEVRKCMNGISYPKCVQIHKRKILTDEETMPPTKIVNSMNKILSEHERTHMVQNKLEETLFKRIDKIESIIENVVMSTEICLEFKLNAIKSLYREMENLEKEFENKMARVNDTVLHLVENGTVKKTAAFEYQRLRNESGKILNTEDNFDLDLPKYDIKSELHMKRNANMLDRLYNIRLSKIEVSIKMAKRTLKETEIHISKLNLEVAYRLLKVQNNLFKNYLNFKNTMENLKLVERRRDDYTPYVGRKSDTFKMRTELCGSLGSRISNYVKAVSSDGKNPSRSTPASSNRIKVPDAFLRDFQCH